MHRTVRILVGVFAWAFLATASMAADQCPPASGVALQVLGSGGPIADDGRASSGYIVWVDGKSRVMIDAGAGTFLRFGEARARFEDIDFIGLSHFHTDHSADFPALLKSGFFSGRERELTVAGPSGDGPFPGLVAYLDALLEPGRGAYAYLSGYRDGSAGLVQLVPKEVADTGEPDFTSVYRDSATQLHVQALHVPHGIVPALGFRVTVGDVVVAFSSDQNGSDPRFVELARDADLLVMHLVIPEGATGIATRLHARPSAIGQIAAESHADRLVLSHLMARSLRSLENNVAVVRESYDGPVLVAEDLDCYVVSD
ncbi:MAG: MBL fold metallo-hydrolase [Woeseiaceae bacterium]|nr:MBL fold metallo-hydrolase [Woeseiaceae bacterium]